MLVIMIYSDSTEDPFLLSRGGKLESLLVCVVAATSMSTPLQI